MKVLHRLIFAVLLLASFGAKGEVFQTRSDQEFTARVIAVLDGDTVLILRDSHPAKVRLADIDAPEVVHPAMHTPNSAQLFGETSKRSLSSLVLGKQVQFITQAVDKYGRLVAHLAVNGLDVNAEQIRRGMAWEYSHYHRNKYLISLENEARQAPRGLWAQSNPMPPWEWRKQHPNSDVPAEPAVEMPEGCGDKKYCSQMHSCEEAQHYLTDCGVTSLDGNADGIPCASLCKGSN